MRMLLLLMGRDENGDGETMFTQRDRFWFSRDGESYVYSSSSGSWMYYANPIADGVSVSKASLPAEILSAI